LPCTWRQGAVCKYYIYLYLYYIYIYIEQKDLRVQDVLLVHVFNENVEGLCIAVHLWSERGSLRLGKNARSLILSNDTTNSVERTRKKIKIGPRSVSGASYRPLKERKVLRCRATVERAGIFFFFFKGALCA